MKDISFKLIVKRLGDYFEKAASTISDMEVYRGRHYQETGSVNISYCKTASMS